MFSLLIKHWISSATLDESYVGDSPGWIKEETGEDDSDFIFNPFFIRELNIKFFYYELFTIAHQRVLLLLYYDSFFVTNLKGFDVLIITWNINDHKIVEG